MREDGTDALGFITERSNTRILTVYDRSGARIVKRGFPLTGTPVVGNYLSGEPGEEVVFQSGTDLMIFNPFSKVAERRSNINGTLAGSTIVEILTASLPAPTPTPQVSPTPTVGI